jgi:hypothetical protein
MSESDAAELLEKIASHCRQAQYPEPLVPAIQSYDEHWQKPQAEEMDDGIPFSSRRLEQL